MPTATAAQLQSESARQFIDRGPHGLLIGGESSPAADGRTFATIDERLLQMRRQKYRDELDLLRRCIRAGEAGHAQAWNVVRPGVNELHVYGEVVGACTEAAGQPVVVYGDFCSGPRTWLRRGGPPTAR